MKRRQYGIEVVGKAFTTKENIESLRKVVLRTLDAIKAEGFVDAVVKIGPVSKAKGTRKKKAPTVPVGHQTAQQDILPN